MAVRRLHAARLLAVLQAALLFASAAVRAASAGADSPDLASRINAYRTEPQVCEGRQTKPAGPLAPDPRLRRVDAQGQPLVEAVKATGYQPARVQLVELSGPGTPEGAMQMLQKHYCKVLTSREYADLGISREGDRWRIVLARPLLSPDLGGWREAGKEVLELVNRARGEPRTCGTTKFAAAAPVEWNANLAAAALAHSRDMARRNYFRHSGPAGKTVADRSRAEGYAWRRVGENIAAGQGSPEQVMSAWLASPHHCANIMQPGFTEMGAAYSTNPKSDSTIYWTQVFGAARK